jgi:multicomponent Na+:H+ antiporter subunit F
MNVFFMCMAIFLLLTLAAGMARVLRGPTAADRMLAAQLFGTTGVAIFVLLAQAWDMERAVDVALVLATLTAVMGVAFSSRKKGTGRD